MFFLGKILIKDIQTFFHDLTKHFIYTLFIVLLASGLTFFLLNKAFGQKIDDVRLSNTITAIKSQTPPVTPNLGDDLYVERGSPYDNRTVGGATQSANVVFHGPR